VTYLNILPQHLPGVSENNHENFSTDSLLVGIQTCVFQTRRMHRPATVALFNDKLLTTDVK